jgi:hypothetical protein
VDLRSLPVASVNVIPSDCVLMTGC